MDVNFGNLTTSSGVKIKFEDMDKDGDGVITEEEYDAALKEYGLDSVELSTVDTNGDKEISNEEFQVWEQKIQMEEALAPYIQQVTTDFIGSNSAYAADMTAALRALIDTFAEEYVEEGNNVSNMALEFETILPTKYEELKEEILSNTPEALAEAEAAQQAAVKSDILDEILQDIGGGVDDSVYSILISNLGAILEAEADTFIANYTGDNLEKDLRTHLQEYLASSEYSKIEDEILAWQTNTSGSKWDYIDSGELETLKDYAKELLNAALEQGFTVMLDGYSYTSASSLERKIDNYTDGQALMDAVNKFIESLGTESLLETEKASAIAEAEEAAEAVFTSISGASYAIDINTIDFSNLEGYYDNEQITVKGKSGHDENIQEEIRTRIEESGIKDQMKEQIKTMLESQGLSFDKVEVIFENVYNSTLAEILDGVESYKSNSAWLNKNKKYTSNDGIQTIVQNFITAFNTNIAAAIDEMNASSTDMDLQDIDYAQAAEEAGVSEGVLEALKNGDEVSICTVQNGSELDVSSAEDLLDALESQLKRKAISMCDANGIEFDENVFNTIFANSKGSTIADYVTVSVYNAKMINLKQEYDTFNPSTLMTMFTNDFKTSYTAWVEKQKSE